jgi:hypothetical protein
MTNAKEKLRRGTPPDAIEDQSKPVREDELEEGEKKSTGTSGGEHKTGVAGRRPVGKGR